MLLSPVYFIGMTTPTEPSKKAATGQSAQGIAVPGVRSVIPGRVAQPSSGSGQSPPIQMTSLTSMHSPHGSATLHPEGSALDLAQLAEEIKALRSENTRLQNLSVKHTDEIHSLKRQQHDSTTDSEGVNLPSGMLCDLLAQAASIISASAGKFVALADITPCMCQDALDKPSLYKRLPPTVVLGEMNGEMLGQI
ncbi:hypothetical protein BS47DRAFT_598024 [Hydnum rufescens UP504]|uniref:Uncharacterized protein n=1 Tax=Hydnum rufescens UP504 TaxID=1448309 RepID=A0A9P6AFL5_9AGAM|nr:hypothetical protein BS47DRAFT_598024 [Hydnum rufescens UP504]